MKQEECPVSLELLQQLQTPLSVEEDHLTMMQEECLAHFQLLQLQTPPWLLLTPAQKCSLQKTVSCRDFFLSATISQRTNREVLLQGNNASHSL
jgi:hypothetical protein